MGILKGTGAGGVSLLAIRVFPFVHCTFISHSLGGGRILLNHIWALLIIVGIVVAGATVVYDTSVVGEKRITSMKDGKEVVEVVSYATPRDKAKAFAEAGNRLTKSAVNSVSFRYTNDKGGESDGAVGLSISLIGIMALWLGLMKIAEEAGLMQALARGIAPLFRILFPSIPKGHPAAGAILMNFAANMLGLDNAATPLGIKAMKELQKLNGDKQTASNAMVMFLCINVSSITLLPASIIGYRAANNSNNLTQFMVPMLIATTIGTATAIISCLIVQRFSKDTPPASAEEAAPMASEGEVQ